MKDENRILNANPGSALRCPSMFSRSLLLVLILCGITQHHTSAQKLEILYSNLDEASSLYVTQNSVYVVEQGKNRLLKFDHSGELLEAIGGSGSGDYYFSKPVDVDATNGLKIYISDYNNRRIQVFDRRGQYLSSISALHDFERRRNYKPTQLTVNDFGEVFFYDEYDKTIQRFDIDVNLIDSFRLSRDIDQVTDMLSVDQQLFILDSGEEVIHVLSENGQYESYYPAEEVMAFYADKEFMWKSYSDRIEKDGGLGEPEILNFDSEITPIDLQVVKGVIFFLSPTTLYKISEN